MIHHKLLEFHSICHPLSIFREFDLTVIIRYLSFETVIIRNYPLSIFREFDLTDWTVEVFVRIDFIVPLAVFFQFSKFDPLHVSFDNS